MNPIVIHDKDLSGPAIFTIKQIAWMIVIGFLDLGILIFATVGAVTAFDWLLNR